MLLRRAIMGLAVVVLVTTTSLRLASAFPEAVVHCCCGDHGLADGCGCPDCPASHDERDHDGPSQPTLARCFVDGASALEILLPVFDHRAVAGVAVRWGPALVSVEATPFAPSRTTEPLLEPPR